MYLAPSEATVSDKKKGGFMGFLSNVGLVEETPDPAPRNTPVPAGPRNTPVPAPYHPNGATADPEVLSKLEKRLQANCPAPYTAFMEQYENLKDVIPDEAMRFKAALKASHTTTDQLVGALDQLASAMDSAHTEFMHTFEENKGKRLGEAEASLKATDEQIATYEKQLQSVQETIQSLHTKRDTDAQAMQHEAQRLEGIRASFEAAHAQVVGRLGAQKSRVQAMPKV